VAAETGFLIEGKIYEVPTRETLTMDEAEFFFDYSGLTLEQFDSAQMNMRAFRALVHIAYQRGNPRVTADEVAVILGKQNLGTVMSLLDDEEDDALPPASTTEPDESSLTSSVGSKQSSGSPSANGTAEQDDQPAPTTDGDSPLSVSTLPISVP